MNAGLLAVALLTQVAQVPVSIESRIGSLDGDTPDVFGNVKDLALDAAERIYVLDDHNHEVRVFSATGEHQFSFGRKGKGPGEFDFPVSIGVADDGVVVQNATGLTIRFTSTGQHIVSDRVVSGLKSGTWLGEDRFAVLRLGSVSLRRTNANEALLLWSGDWVDTITTAPSSDLFVRVEGRSLARRTELCGLLHYARDQAGRLLVATGTDGYLRRGRLLDDQWTWDVSKQVAGEGSPLTDDDFEELLAAVPEDYGAETEHLVTTPVRSSICGLEVGRDDRVWVRMPDEGERQIWVAYEPEALAPLVSVRMPPGVDVMAFGRDRAVGKALDDLGVSYVLVLSMAEPD